MNSDCYSSSATVALLQYRSYNNSQFSATVSVNVLATVSLDFLATMSLDLLATVSLDFLATVSLGAATVSLGAATVPSLLFIFFNLKLLENKESIINENKTKFKTNLIVGCLPLSAYFKSLS